MRFLAFLLLLAAGCFAPAALPSRPSPESRSLHYTYHISPEFSLADQQAMVEVILSAHWPGVRLHVQTGPLVSSGAIPVRRTWFPGCVFSGLWRPDSRDILIDPGCTPGDRVLRHVTLHEVGHSVGMRHVCRFAGETPGCSPVGLGLALMNPFFRAPGDPCRIPVELCAPPYLAMGPLDRLELARALQRAHHVRGPRGLGL